MTMTITYTGKVANAKLFAFSRLLFYWKGSIYKLMYKEMLVFCSIYATLSLTYRLALNDSQRRTFERIVKYCDAFTNLIPLSFVLGFYVALCVGRWWNQYLNIPWPDRVMMYVTTMIDGCDERSRIIRRSIMRYLSLSSLIVFQATSVSVKKRFPTMDHLLDAGLITPKEVAAMDEIHTPHGKWWVPFVWICNLIKEARKEGRIADTYLMKAIIDEVQQYRGNLGMLFSYDWISVPLVYTQVTTLAVYSFFLGCVFGRQFLDPSQHYQGHEVDLYIPFFTLLQFFFYMGWLKVAEQLINPFGEDDDDFEINWVIDRNLQVSLLVTDEMYGSFPQPEKDQFYGENPPDYLPYTLSTIDTITQPHMGSTADLSVSSEGMKVVNPMETIQEGEATQPVSHYPVHVASPVSSPYPNRRQQFPNMMAGCHTPAGMITPFSASKSTLDGIHKVPGSCSSGHPSIVVGSMPGKLSSRLENILSGTPAWAISKEPSLGPRSISVEIIPKTSKAVDVPFRLNVHEESSGIMTSSVPVSRMSDAIITSSPSSSSMLDTKRSDDFEKTNENRELQTDDFVCEITEDEPENIDWDNAMPDRNFSDEFKPHSEFPKPLNILPTLLETDRNRHSSDEQSVDYNESSHSSFSSFAPLLKNISTNKEANA